MRAAPHHRLDGSRHRCRGGSVVRGCSNRRRQASAGERHFLIVARGLRDHGLRADRPRDRQGRDPRQAGCLGSRSRMQGRVGRSPRCSPDASGSTPSRHSGSTCCERRSRRTRRRPAAASACRSASISARLPSTIFTSVHPWEASIRTGSSPASALLAAHEQSRLKLDMARTDGPAAKVAADLGFDLDHFTVDGTIDAEESSQGGVIAALIERPDLQNVSFKFAAKGGRDDGTATLDRRGGRRDEFDRWRALASRSGCHGDLARHLRRRARPARQSARPPVAPARNPERHGDARRCRRPCREVAGAGGRSGKSRDHGPLRYQTRCSGGHDHGHDGGGGTIGRSRRRRDLAQSPSRRQDQPVGPVAPATAAASSLKGAADDVSATGLDPRAPPPGHVDLAAEIGLERSGRIVVKTLETTSALVGLKGSGDFTPSSQA